MIYFENCIETDPSGEKCDDEATVMEYFDTTIGSIIEIEYS